MSEYLERDNRSQIIFFNMGAGGEDVRIETKAFLEKEKSPAKKSLLVSMEPRDRYVRSGRLNVEIDRLEGTGGKVGGFFFIMKFFWFVGVEDRLCYLVLPVASLPSRI